MLPYILLVIGFILIIKASDVLVDSSSSIAIRKKVPKILIALTIVAFGTCAPEFAISFNSIASNNGSVALANVIGSCIINIVLIIGIASIVHPIKLKNATIKKELPILVFITGVFITIMIRRLWTSNFLARIDGLLLVLVFVMFITYLIRLVKKDKGKEQLDLPKYSMARSMVYLILSLIVIIYSSELIVDNAVIIAESIGISQKIITMVVIVIGTSLPELVTTVTAARKNEFEMAIGNIIGTNVFNICIVLGLPVAIFGNLTMVDFSLIDFIVVMSAAFMLYAFSKSGKKLSRIEGLIMVAVFIVYYIFILFIQ